MVRKANIEAIHMNEMNNIPQGAATQDYGQECD